MKFEICGPFEIKKSNHRVDKSHLPDFWKSVNESHPSFSDPQLSDACGCYLFALRAGGGYMPWYVGQVGKRSFVQECFDYHKRDIYDDVISSKKGTPVLFLIAKLTNSNKKFVKPGKSSHRDIEYLETLLIGSALKKNSELMNIKKTDCAKNMIVPGVVNTPRGAGRKKAVRELRKTLG